MFKKSRKGVSPVIATLLLIVIAVAAAVVTYSWVMGFIGTTTTTPAQTQARIVVDAVKPDAANDEIDEIYVRNVGSVSVNVIYVYVYRADGTLEATADLTSSPVSISPGGVTNILSSSITGLTDGQTYYVKVVTKEGAAATSESFSV